MDQRPTEVAAAEVPGLHGLLFVAIAVVVVAALYLRRSVLFPITLAVLLSFLLAPLVDLPRRLYLGRILSVLMSVLLALVVILAVGGLIGTQLAGLAEEVPRYALTIQQKIDTPQQFLTSRIVGLTLGLSRHRDVAAAPATARSASPSAETRKLLQVEAHQPDMTAIELARRIVTPVVEPLSTTAIVLIVSIFILLQREDLRDRMIWIFGSSDLHRTALAMRAAVGANYYTSSLHEAVETCLKVLRPAHVDEQMTAAAA